MTNDEIRMLKERLSAEWLTKKTDIFNPDIDPAENPGAKEEALRCAAAFREYWLIWLRSDVAALFEMLEEIPKLKDKIKSLEDEIDEIGYDNSRDD